MRRFVAVILAMTVVSEAAWARRKPSVPMPAVSARGRLAGKDKVIYLLRQVELTEDQRKFARGLMDSTLDIAGDDLSLDRVYQLMAEIQQAEANGDEAAKAALETELRELGKGSTRGEEEFFMNFEPELSDAQKAALKTARERLKRNPSGSLRPIDIFRLLPTLKPTPEQTAQFEKILADLRASLRKTKTLQDRDRFQLVNGLLAMIKKHLTAEQKAEFELGINRLRPDMVFGLQVKLEEDMAGGTDPESAEVEGTPQPADDD